MVNTRDSGKAAKNVGKKLNSIRKKGHSYRKILLSLTKLKLEDKERKSKMAYLERKLEHKRITLENLKVWHKFDKFFALEEDLVKKGEQQDKKFLKKQEKYNTDLYLRETWGNQMYMIAADMYGGRKEDSTEMKAERENHNSSEDDSGFYEEILQDLVEREAPYLLCEEKSLTKSETETENDDENYGPESEVGATEPKATTRNSRGPVPEGKQGRITETATTPENDTQNSDSSDSDDELLIRFVGDNIKNPPDRDNFKRSVAWNIERHIQWAGKEFQWKNKEELCSTLDVKLDPDLRCGIVGKGNLSLNENCCAYDAEGYHWGRPAAELEMGARRVGKSAAWMTYDEPRRFLISLENWYFQLEQEEKKALIGDAFEWFEFRDACIGDPYAPNWEAWEGAFGKEITGFFETLYPACGI